MKNLKIKKPVAKVSKEEMEAEISTLRNKYAEIKVKEDGSKIEGINAGYVNAGKYLDLIKEQNGVISLSSIGKNIMDRPPARKQLGFVHQILQHDVFNDILKTQLKTGLLLSKSEIINTMKKYPLFNVKGESTYTRRASTISSWINWVTSLII